MNQENKSKKSGIIGLIALVAVVAILACCYFVFGPKTTKGAKAITITVISNDGSSKDYSLNTDAEFLRKAMDEVQDLTYSGSESEEFGMMIDTINGVRADYTLDNAYWAIYVNGEYGSYGIDQQPVADKDAYKFEYTKAS